MKNDRHGTGCIHHVYSRSIAGYKIFNDQFEYGRMIEVLEYYKPLDVPIRFSNYKKTCSNLNPPCQEKLIEILAYCLMPTHIHLVLAQKEDYGISNYMSKCLNSYTKYFNERHKRKGPLWEFRFKSSLISTNEILEHVIRYVHLNPTTANLVANPIEWEFSSYHEYLDKNIGLNKICDLDDRPNATTYRAFTESQIDYQKELSLIKHLTHE